jgi:hypothetical protein
MKYVLFFLLLSFNNTNAFVYESAERNATVFVGGVSTVMLVNYFKEKYEISKTQSFLLSFGSVLLLSVAKEAYYDTQFNKTDVEAAFLGGLLAVPIINLTF